MADVTTDLTPPETPETPSEGAAATAAAPTVAQSTGGAAATSAATESGQAPAAPVPEAAPAAPVPAPSSGPDTWPKLLQANAERLGAKHKAMRYKHYGIWQSYSWQDYLDRVKYLALGLLALGFQPGHKLLIVGDNRPEWYFAQLAAQSVRGLSVGLYSDLSASEIEYIARNSAAEFAMVEDQEQVDKITQIGAGLPALKMVIYWRYKGLSGQSAPGAGGAAAPAAPDNGDGDGPADDELDMGAALDAISGGPEPAAPAAPAQVFYGLREVLEKGRRYEAEHPQAFAESVAAGKAGDPCALIYTSGVTSRPKAALHSYRSLMTDARAFAEAEKLTPKTNIVSYLPPAWITEQWLALGCHLFSGGMVNFAESAETQREDVREIAPTLVVYNSRLWEAEAGEVLAKLHQASWLKRVTTKWTLPVGYKMVDAVYAGRGVGMLKVLDVLAGMMAFRPIRDHLGLTRARACYTSGSLLSSEALRFFHALRIPLRNVYGSSEAGAVTGAAVGRQSPVTVGKVNPEVEIKLSEDGEILVKHPGTFLGYHADGELTPEVLQDGWVHTGDKGEITPEGELRFIDYLDDMILLPCGDLVAPQEIESRLKFSPYIKDAWVHAEQGCESLSAVIIIDALNTGHWADKRKVAFTTFGDLSQKPEVYELIRDEIAKINEDLPQTRHISRYVNLHKEFDPDEQELTRNRKLRRNYLRERYAGLAKALSGTEGSVEVEAEITYQDGRVGRVKTALQIATVGRGDE